MKLGVCDFSDLAKVSLGFKSLQNQFFYVSKEEIEKYGRNISNQSFSWQTLTVTNTSKALKPFNGFFTVRIKKAISKGLELFDISERWRKYLLLKRSKVESARQ